MMRAVLDSAVSPADVVQLLDDHHLVVVADSAEVRRAFGGMLERHLRMQSETEVLHLDGANAVDLPSFCRQLERCLPLPPLEQNSWWRDMQSVIEVLRRVPGSPKRRFFVWHEAQAMLAADVKLFCRVVNALLGLAAEHEHINPDLLILQRVVFLGDGKLGAYAADPNGQFCRWLEDEDGSPFWEVASAVDRPPVLAYRIEG